MAWCPKCKCEYIAGITVCADCGCELVDELVEEKNAQGDMEAFLTEDVSEEMIMAAAQAMVENGDIPEELMNADELEGFAFDEEEPAPSYQGAKSKASVLCTGQRQIAAALTHTLAPAAPAEHRDFRYSPAKWIQFPQALGPRAGKPAFLSPSLPAGNPSAAGLYGPLETPAGKSPGATPASFLHEHRRLHINCLP